MHKNKSFAHIILRVFFLHYKGNDWSSTRNKDKDGSSQQRRYRYNKSCSKICKYTKFLPYFSLLFNANCSRFYGAKRVLRSQTSVWVRSTKRRQRGRYRFGTFYAQEQKLCSHYSPCFFLHYKGNDWSSTRSKDKDESSQQWCRYNKSCSKICKYTIFLP